MQLSHARPVATVRFDDPNLVSSAGLVPLVVLAEQCGLRDLAGEHLSVATSCDLPPTARPARITHDPLSAVENYNPELVHFSDTPRYLARRLFPILNADLAELT